MPEDTPEVVAPVPEAEPEPAPAPAVAPVPFVIPTSEPAPQPAAAEPEHESRVKRGVPYPHTWRCINGVMTQVAIGAEKPVSKADLQAMAAQGGK